MDTDSLARATAPRKQRPTGSTRSRMRKKGNRNGRAWRHFQRDSFARCSSLLACKSIGSPLARS